MKAVPRPSLRFTKPVSSLRRAGSFAVPAAVATGSPRRRRSSRSRSSGVWKRRSSCAAPAVVASAHRARATSRSTRAAGILFLQGDPLEGALDLDPGLQRLGRGRLEAAQRAAVERKESLAAGGELLDEAEHVALVQSAHAQLHPAREHVDRREHAAAGELQRPLRRDLVVECEELVARAQAVDELHHVEPAFALQQAAIDQRAEDVGGLAQVVALAARSFQARARLLEALACGDALACLVVEIPLAPQAEADGGRGGHGEQRPRAAQVAEPLGREYGLHAAPRRSRRTRRTKRVSIVDDCAASWRPCSESEGRRSSGLAITSAVTPGRRESSSASFCAWPIAPRKSSAGTRSVPSSSATS